MKPQNVPTLFKLKVNDSYKPVMWPLNFECIKGLKGVKPEDMHW